MRKRTGGPRRMHGRREKRSSEINRKVNVRSGERNCVALQLQASSSSSPFGFLFCFSPPLFFCLG